MVICYGLHFMLVFSFGLLIPSYMYGSCLCYSKFLEAFMKYKLVEGKSRAEWELNFCC